MHREVRPLDFVFGLTDSLISVIALWRLSPYDSSAAAGGRQPRRRSISDEMLNTRSGTCETDSTLVIRLFRCLRCSMEMCTTIRQTTRLSRQQQYRSARALLNWQTLCVLQSGVRLTFQPKLYNCARPRFFTSGSVFNSTPGECQAKPHEQRSRRYFERFLWVHC